MCLLSLLCGRWRGPSYKGGTPGTLTEGTTHHSLSCKYSGILPTSAFQAGGAHRCHPDFTPANGSGPWLTRGRLLSYRLFTVGF